MTAHSRTRDEGGAALLLAVTVMLVIGMLSAAMLASLTNGLDGRKALDATRNREYAADAGIEQAVTTVRTTVTSAPGISLTSCGPAAGWAYASFDGVAIRVNCTDAPAATRLGLLERDVVFTACVDTGVPCTDATAVIRAQVNFQTPSPTAYNTVRTYVQSWSVNL